MRIEVPPDFVILVISHKRPQCTTAKTLQQYDCQFPWYIMVDDGDPTIDEYRKRWGDRVIVFSRDIARDIDYFDNTGNVQSILLPRNASFDVAERLGYEYFWMLDDDYTEFCYTHDGYLRPYPPTMKMRKTFNAAVLATLTYYRNAKQFRSLCWAQGGDFIGGVAAKPLIMLRKAMNTFLCSTRRRFWYVGRMNEDVNTYVSMGRQGELFGTTIMVRMSQKATQSGKGGLTEMYLDNGTYRKAFSTVMVAPSCTKVGVIINWQRNMRHYYPRMHHRVAWDYAAVKILSASYQKPDQGNGGGQ